MERHNEGYLLFSKKPQHFGYSFREGCDFFVLSSKITVHIYTLVREVTGRSSINTFNIKTAFHISFQMGEVFRLVNIL